MAVEQLSVQQQLLLAQAVHQVGEPQDFVKVAGLLKTHPLLPDGAGRTLASPEMCYSTYTALQQSHSTESSPAAVKVRPSFALARTLYYRRIEELKTAISSEEAKFRILNAEIEEIKRGDWDAKLKDPEEREKVLRTSAFGEVEDEKEEKDQDVGEEAASPGRDKGKKKMGRPRRGTLIEEEEELVPDSQEEAAEEDEATAPKRKGRLSKGGRKPSIVPTPSRRKSRSRVAKEEEDEGEEEEEDAMEVDSPAAPEERGNKRKAAEPPSAASPKRARRSSGTEEVAEPSTPSVDPAVFRRRILQIQSQLSQHTCSSPFREPVRENDAPDYASIIKRPMDLKAIAKRIREGKIVTPEDFRRDVLLMLSNAVVYNRRESEVAKNAKDMLELVENLVDLYVSTQYS